MKSPILAAAFALCAAPLAAQTCDPSPAEPVPAFETLKTILIDGATREAMEPLLGRIQLPDEMWDQLLVRVPEAFPQGFDGCNSIVLRRDDPGFVQEIFALDSAGDGPSLYFYVNGMQVDGAVEILGLGFQSSPGRILEELR
jgi:hypothetical protein